MIKRWRRICNFSANGKEGPAVLTNNKQENLDQIEKERKKERNRKIFFPKAGAAEKIEKPAATLLKT
jgi:hypothetical protein